MIKLNKAVKNEVAPVAKKSSSKASAKAVPSYKSNISFGKWLLEVARARGELASFIAEAKADKKLTADLTIEAAKKRTIGKHPMFAAAADRYEGFRIRGSQPGPRKAA
jgi:hypothetical protein